MKTFRSICNIAATGILLMVVAAPSTSFADEQVCTPERHRMMSMEGRADWAKHQLDKEAAWLEIKASQQLAWEAFTAANMELISRLGERKPLSPGVDAATAMRQHAEHAAAFAQSISRLASATESLQSVLGEDQRKVLDRIVRRHSQLRDRRISEGMQDHEHCHHESEMSQRASRLPPKSAIPAKPKN